MRTHVLTHLGDAVLLRDLAALASEERSATAAFLPYIAEVDARKLYAPAGFPSMQAYCVGELHLSEDEAKKRIQVARAARRLPVLFTVLAEGRVHLTGLRLLAPHLTPENVDELIAAATHRSKSRIEQLIAGRFPQTEPLPLTRVIPASDGSANAHPAEPAESITGEGAPGHPAERDAAALEGAPGHPRVVASRSRVAPIAAERFELQLAIDKSTHDLLRYAQALLGHSIPSGDIGQVLDRALRALVEKLERRKFAATTKPRPSSSRPSADPRHIPAHVKRAVLERDQGQCAFVSETGRRCGSRTNLEFDHAIPVARGGAPTVDNVRLLCRTHNQHAAERVFGAGLMDAKREAARRAAAEKRAQATAEQSHANALAQEHSRDVMAGLRGLGVQAERARQATEFAATLAGATLEERMRAALRFLAPRAARTGAPAGAAS